MRRAWGLGPKLDVFFDESPAFRLGPDAAAEGVRPGRLVRVRTAAAQRLGLGPALPRGRGGDCRRPVGEGRLVLLGPEVTMRGQTHASFKFLFNGIYGAAGETPTAQR